MIKILLEVHGGVLSSIWVDKDTHEQQAIQAVVLDKDLVDDSVGAGAVGVNCGDLRLGEAWQLPVMIMKPQGELIINAVVADEEQVVEVDNHG